MGGVGAQPDDVIEKLNHDVRDLVRLFAEVTGEILPFVSLRTVTKSCFQANPTSVCNRYHRDSSVITFFKTVIGAGTESTPIDLSPGTSPIAA